VVSTDEFGHVAEGNVGEFVKFLPGVTVEYGGGYARGIVIDGVPSVHTPITVDGFSLASTGGPNNTNRSVQVDMASINSISRIEVAFSPTPESQGPRGFGESGAAQLLRKGPAATQRDAFPRDARQRAGLSSLRGPARGHHAESAPQPGLLVCASGHSALRFHPFGRHRTAIHGRGLHPEHLARRLHRHQRRRLRPHDTRPAVSLHLCGQGRPEGHRPALLLRHRRRADFPVRPPRLLLPVLLVQRRHDQPADDVQRQPRRPRGLRTHLHAGCGRRRRPGAGPRRPRPHQPHVDALAHVAARRAGVENRSGCRALAGHRSRSRHRPGFLQQHAGTTHGSHRRLRGCRLPPARPHRRERRRRRPRGSLPALFLRLHAVQQCEFQHHGYPPQRPRERGPRFQRRAAPGAQGGCRGPGLAARSPRRHAGLLVRRRRWTPEHGAGGRGRRRASLSRSGFLPPRPALRASRGAVDQQ
ncbi:MAG: Plug domain-containing protein, partial [Verrucomicrobia bacterium]|nr:Plug domain-containing protein [Verrucomicrobiota bacterium]